MRGVILGEADLEVWRVQLQAPSGLSEALPGVESSPPWVSCTFNSRWGDWARAGASSTGGVLDCAMPFEGCVVKLGAVERRI